MKRTSRLLLLMAGILLASSGVYAQEWNELVTNGNFEGTDFSSFSIKPKNEDIRALVSDDIVVDEDDANNHCVKMDRTQLSRTATFIINLSEPLSKGSIMKFSMRAKSLKKTSVSSNVIDRINNITQEWKEYTYKNIVKEEQDGIQTITLGGMLMNTAEFYLDDISVKVSDGSTPIVFADDKVKEICVSHWDTNGDGELSEAEAAAVTDLDGAFRWNQEISSFNELQYFLGVTEIKDEFSYCYNLTSVIIPNNVTKITGHDAFTYCENLVSVTLGNKVETINGHSFYGCSALASIKIPRSLTSFEDAEIGEHSFQTCYGLTSIMVEDGNPIYDSRENCNAIIRTRDNTLLVGSSNSFIPNTVTTIDRWAFRYRSGLASLTIPKSVRTIGSYAFDGCGDLNTIVVEDGNPTYDSRDNCNALIETATDSLITGCNNTVIPNSVKKIAPAAFLDCSGLTTVTIPRSVTSIGGGAFSGTSLFSMVVEEGNPIYDSRNNCNAIIETATNSLIAGCQNTIIPNDVVIIGNGAFYNCSGPTSVVIPNSVEKIDYCAFYGCGLTSVVIPNSVTSIGDYAFKNCLGLTSVSIDNSKTSIGFWAFDRCLNLSSVSLGDNITFIDVQAFGGCVSLTSIKIPNSMTKIESCTFASSGLTSVVIGNRVESIESLAFYCPNLIDVYCYAEEVPDARTKYGNPVFYTSNNISGTLHVPAASKEKYSNTDPWMYFENIVALTDNDPKPTGITNINNDIEKGERYYSLDGKRMAQPQRGLNIIRKSDGTTSKVVVK